MRAWDPGKEPKTIRIRVILGEDSLIVREGIRSLLQGDRDIELVADVGDSLSLRDACDRERHDVVLADIRVPPTGTDGAAS